LPQHQSILGRAQPPSASLFRAQVKINYDDQGRVYQTQVYDVNPTTGTVSTTALTTIIATWWLKALRAVCRPRRNSMVPAG
jgi:hypothetical protein